MMAYMEKHRVALSFDDVLLEPKYSEVMSRKEVEIKQRLKNVRSEPFTLPIIASPMDTISEVEMARAASDCGGVAIIHRYNSIEEQAAMVMDVINTGHTVGAAIGVGDDFVKRAEAPRS